MTSNVIITVKLSYFRQKKKIKENFKVYCTTKKKETGIFQVSYLVVEKEVLEWVRFEVKPVGLEDFPNSSSLICFLTLTFTILYMIGFEACPIKKKYFKTNDLYTFKILMLNGIQQTMYRNVQIDNIVHVLVSTLDLFCAAETPLDVVELLLSRDNPDFEEDNLPLSGPI